MPPNAAGKTLAAGTIIDLTGATPLACNSPAVSSR